MCGIVAYVAGRATADVTNLLLEGLQRLEYRGYDSAGLAVIADGRIHDVKVAGRVADLRAVTDVATPARVGIAHTRWATHGAPTAVNAHPHLDESHRFAVVHNGIIENADELRAKLRADGVELVSETDTEVVAHLVARAHAGGTGVLECAVRAALAEVEGTYGLVVMDRDEPDQLVVARNGSPVVVGLGDDATFVASDVSAFVRHTQRACFLDDGEVVTVTSSGFGSVTAGASPTADRTTTVVAGEDGGYELGAFDSFMRKEIHDQPRALRRALSGRLDTRFATARFGGIDLDARELRAFRRVKILGCGSAYYAGQQGAVAIEEIARVPADAEPAAEFRYRNPVVDPDTLYIAVSQSGETVDTLMAVQELQRKGATVLGMVNVVGSAIARETGRGIFIHAGPELSVASTKALTNMTASFAMVGLLLGRVRDLSPTQGARLVAGLQALPDAIAAVVEREDDIAALAPFYAAARSMYFIGRHRAFPVAREGAQKLKEISYVHAEAYQASELKHGPLALVDTDMPSVVIVPDDELLPKNLATIEQIRSRGGRVLVVTNRELPADAADHVVTVPAVEPELDPIVLTVPLQILACHVAGHLQRDVDKPRNLAKSVTVE